MTNLNYEIIGLVSICAYLVISHKALLIIISKMKLPSGAFEDLIPIFLVVILSFPVIYAYFKYYPEPSNPFTITVILFTVAINIFTIFRTGNLTSDNNIR